jgi:hypothetical protein
MMESTCFGRKFNYFTVTPYFDVIGIIFITEDIIVLGHRYFYLFEEIVNNSSIPE